MSSLRRLIIGSGILAAAVVLAGAVFLAQLHWRSAAEGIEIGVFFPAPSEKNWIDFLEGIRLAAREAGLALEEHGTEADGLVAECTVRTSPQPVMFRWYREVGARKLQRRVSEVCRSRCPPLALVGANNTSLTRALTEALSQCENHDKVPALLMTTATADDLTDILPDRSFRFGFNDTYQAHAVVQRLQDFYAAHQLVNPRIKALVVRVLDDPFSMDLANGFVRALGEQPGVELIPPSRPLRQGAKGARAIWSLPTTTAGAVDDVSSEEWLLTRRMVRTMLADPEKQWVVALPISTAAIRRVTFAIRELLQLAKTQDQETVERIMHNLVFLSGDSPSYYTFLEWRLNQQFAPDEVPGPVIFFSHTNPVDRTVADPPNRHVPARGLNRDVVRALLAVVPQLGRDPTPIRLAAALERYTPPGVTVPFFAGHERRQGGGAIVAIPRPDIDDYEMVLPSQWRLIEP